MCSIYMYVYIVCIFCKAGSFRIRKCCTFGATNFTLFSFVLFYILTTFTYVLKMNTHI